MRVIVRSKIMRLLTYVLIAIMLTQNISFLSDSSALAVDTPTLAWLSPLSATVTADVNVGSVLPIKFKWTNSNGHVHDESVSVRVRNAVTGTLISGFTYGAQISINDSSGEYSLNFDPAKYRLAVGTQLKAMVYFGGRLKGTALAKIVQASEVDSIGRVEPLDPNKIITDNESGQQVVNDQVLITFKDTITDETARGKIAAINGEVVGYITGMNDYQVRIKNNPTLAQLKDIIEQLNSDPDVEVAILNTVDNFNQLLPAQGMDPKWFEGNQDSWDENNPRGKNWGLEAIFASTAWNHNDEMSKVKVGILDTAIDFNHEDLNIPVSNIQNNMNLPHNHGTHIAGVIGAKSNNDKGITGILWNRDIYGYTPNFTEMMQTQIYEHKLGLIWLLKKGAKVINVSQGMNYIGNNLEYPPTDVQNYLNEPKEYWTAYLKKLINKNYDFLIIQSAGNDSINAKWNGFFTAIDDPEVKSRVIVVGAMKRNSIFDWLLGTYQYADFSNYGPLVDVLAPGVDIYSTITNNYNYMSGTSMAAPHVTGVAGMVWAVNTNLTGPQIKQIITGTADRPITFKGRNYNILNAKAAVERAKSTEATQPIPQSPTGIVMGKIVDANNQSTGIQGALISVFKGGNYFASTASDVDGSYELILEPGDYQIFVSKDGYISDFTNVTVSEGITTYPFTLRAVRNSNTNGTVQGIITSAINGQGVSGVVVKFRRGINSTTGDVVDTTTTNYGGVYSISLPPGNYTAEVTGIGYSTGYFYAVSIGGETKGNQNAAIAPVLPEGQTRIVLTWGATPSDLDSHLTGPTPDGGRFHIAYYNKEYYYNGEKYVDLDLDDTSSYGPETTTIYNQITATTVIEQIDGKYRFTVHDYSNGGSYNSTALSNSGAQVQVYRGSNLVATYNVPSDIVGTYWNVFEMNGDNITPINTVSNNSNY